MARPTCTERCRVGNSGFLPFATCPYFLLLCAAGEGSLLRRRRAPRRIGAKMLDIALGFFIALIVIISFTGLVFLYPLTFRVSVSQGHMALPTAPEDGGEPEVAVQEKKDDDKFEYVEAVMIRVINARELRLRAEAMARVHSERPHPLDLHLLPGV